MNCRLTVLFLLSLLLLFLTSCETKPSTAENEQQPSYFNTGQRAVTDISSMEKRDGVPVLPTPGAQIDENKVDSMLEEGNTSFSAIVNAGATEEDLKNNVDNLRQLLRNEGVRTDKELQFVFHTMLGNAYLRLYENSEQQNYLDLSTEHADSAISIFENQPEYKADLAGAYMLFSRTYFLNKEYNKAISLKKYLIEEFQEIGYGPYKNWFASSQVEGLYNLARMDSVESVKTQEIADYLAEIAEKYNNEVGITAQIALAEYYYREGEQNKVRALSESVNNRMTSLNNSAFKDDKWSRVKDYAARMENQSKELADRDTLFYEIQPDMIAQTRLHEAKEVAEYRISVLLKEDYHSEYEQLTRENIGNFLAVKYEGEVVSPGLPTIQAGISNGRFSLVFKKEEQAKKVMQEILE